MTNCYGEIYTVRGKWWGLINDKLINPTDHEKKTLESDWLAFKNLINGPVRKFHDAIAHRYHPITYAFYGDDKKHRTWGEVVWERKLHHSVRMPDAAVALDDFQDARVLRDSGQGVQTLLQQSGRLPMATRFILAEANENGDGTVPIRSGKAPQGKVSVCIGYPGIDHEGAYQQQTQRLFTLWSIVKIVQQVKPPLRYAIDGACPP